MKPSENPDDDLAKDTSPSKTPTARNTPVSGQLYESKDIGFNLRKLTRRLRLTKKSTDFIDELPMDGGKKVNVEVSLDGCDASYFDERMVGDLKRKIMSMILFVVKNSTKEERHLARRNKTKREYKIRLVVTGTQVH